RRTGGLAHGDGRVRGALRAAALARAARGGTLRRGDGLPRPLLHGDERARGDARDRAPHRAARPPVLSPRLPVDASGDCRPRRPPRDRRRDAIRGSLAGRARTVAGGAEHGEEAAAGLISSAAHCHAAIRSTDEERRARGARKARQALLTRTALPIWAPHPVTLRSDPRTKNAEPAEPAKHVKLS